MDQITAAFYRQLDECYRRGELSAVEQLLLDYETNASSLSLRIAVYNELGSFYRGTSRYGLSFRYFQRAREEIAGSRGTHCLEYATVLNNLAGTCRLAGQYDQAAALFHEAIRIYEVIGAEGSYAYASVHNNLSLVYQELGQTDRAVSHLKTALTLIRQMPEQRQELAITCTNLAALCDRAGNREEAMAYLTQALEIYESCEDEENVHYAAALNALAALLFRAGEFSRAISLYRKAADYTKRFFGENVEYAITHRNMSLAFEALGDLTSAAQALRTAEDTYRALFGPEHPRTVDAQKERQRIQGGSAHERT